MSYRHSMKTDIHGIRALSPAKWRGFDGIMSVLWEAEGKAGGAGYYLSPDPRIMFFFDNVADQISMSSQGPSPHLPMQSAVFVPAGTPLWTCVKQDHRFRHLDLHIHHDRIMRLLSVKLGSSMAQSVLRRGVNLQDVGALAPLAQLLARETAQPANHPLFAETLVDGLCAGLLDLSHQDLPMRGGLTGAQMTRLRLYADQHLDGRISVAEMAEVAGLSESWFSEVFRQTTGLTPMRWHLQRRITVTQKFLLKGQHSIAEIALLLGFTDQAHLTRAFRSVTGQTPAVWRREQLIK